MKFLDFRESLKFKVIFNLQDIRKVDPKFDRRRLVEWQNGGYLIKVRQGYYVFSDQAKSESFLYYLANQLYKPSYISLTSAMSFYGLIPEAVFGITSLGPLKTSLFETPYGRYDYKRIKPPLFFGYQMVKVGDFKIKMAEPEKMMLDYCYYHKPSGIEDFEALRINKEDLKNLIDFDRLNSYSSYWKSSVMSQRVNLFKSFLHV